MKINKTTDYFNITIEEASKTIYDDMTREEAKVYEVLLFEFVADNSNHNKYCMVFA